MFAGIDYQAWRFAFMLYAANQHGVAIRIGEIFSQREELSVRARRIHDLCELLGIVKGGKLLVRRMPIWGDAANPQDTIEINAAFKRGFRSARGAHVVSPLRVVGVANDNKIRKASVLRINDHLAARSLRFVRTLPRVHKKDAHWQLGYNAGSAGVPMDESRFIWEIEHWAYPTPKEGKVDLKEDPDDNTADGADCIAASRYALMSWWKGAKELEGEDLDPWSPEALATEADDKHHLKKRLARRKRQRRYGEIVEDY